MNPALLNFLHLACLHVQSLYLKRSQVDCVLGCKCIHLWSLLLYFVFTLGVYVYPCVCVCVYVCDCVSVCEFLVCVFSRR